MYSFFSSHEPGEVLTGCVFLNISADALVKKATKAVDPGLPLKLISATFSAPPAADTIAFWIDRTSAVSAVGLTWMNQSAAVPLNVEDAEDLVAENVEETVPAVEADAEERVEKAVPSVEADAEERVAKWVKETVTLFSREFDIEVFLSSTLVPWFELLEISSSFSSSSSSWSFFGLDSGGS